MLQPSDVGTQAPGRFVRVQDGWAFVPDPLPPRIQLEPRLIRKLEEASRELGHLNGIGRTLVNPHLLIRPFVTREAVLSSKIEGSQATLSDVLLSEAEPGRRTSETQEVSNYVAALDHGLERAKTRPVGLNLLLELHEILMSAGAGPSPGEFRRIQNWIGPPGSRISEATYVPPPVPEMIGALDRMEKFIHATSDLPLLVRLALIHYQFEAIHPFIDGNGRVGRLLIALLLCTEGVLRHPLLYLSEFFERYRPRYYELLLSVTRDGEWGEWIDFFLTAIAAQAHDAGERVVQLQALRDRIHRKFQAARSSAMLLKLIDELFVSPYLTFARAQRILRMTPRGASLNVLKLVDGGVLRKMRSSGRPAVFVAPQVLEIISYPARERR